MPFIFIIFTFINSIITKEDYFFVGTNNNYNKNNLPILQIRKEDINIFILLLLFLNNAVYIYTIIVNENNLRV